MKCPACKVEMDLHGPLDMETCLCKMAYHSSIEAQLLASQSALQAAERIAEMYKSHHKMQFEEREKVQQKLAVYIEHDAECARLLGCGEQHYQIAAAIGILKVEAEAILAAQPAAGVDAQKDYDLSLYEVLDEMCGAFGSIEVNPRQNRAFLAARNALVSKPTTPAPAQGNIAVWASDIVEAITQDLNDRKGLHIDELDDDVQSDIREVWIAKVAAILAAPERDERKEGE